MFLTAESCPWAVRGRPHIYPGKLSKNPLVGYILSFFSPGNPDNKRYANRKNYFCSVLVDRQRLHLIMLAIAGCLVNEAIMSENWLVPVKTICAGKSLKKG